MVANSGLLEAMKRNLGCSLMGLSSGQTRLAGITGRWFVHFLSSFTALWETSNGQPHTTPRSNYALWAVIVILLDNHATHSYLITTLVLGHTKHSQVFQSCVLMLQLPASCVSLAAVRGFLCFSMFPLLS